MTELVNLSWRTNISLCVVFVWHVLRAGDINYMKCLAAL